MQKEIIVDIYIHNMKKRFATLIFSSEKKKNDFLSYLEHCESDIIVYYDVVFSKKEFRYARVRRK